MHGKIDIAIKNLWRIFAVSTNKNNPQETEAVNFEPRLHGGIL